MKSQFDQTTFSQIYCLCKIIAESKVKQKSYIYHRYSDYAVSFDETLNFLKDTKIVRDVSDELLLREKIPDLIQSPSMFKEFLLVHIFSIRSEVTNQLMDFLSLFNQISNQFIFRPTTIDKIRFSSIRNLLIELDFMYLDNMQNSYIINQTYAHLFVEKLNSKAISFEQFKREQVKKEELGFAAEKAVIEFELKRLAGIQIEENDIKHIAEHNISAGYDIESYEDYLDNNSNRIVRYIEVKAVSILDYCFYWSKNEIEKSKIYRENYFLYLLPVKSYKMFDFENIKIVCDPFKNVYENIAEWSNNVEVISIRKINK